MNDFGLNIRQGYRLHPDTSLFTLVEDLRRIMVPIQRSLQIREIASLCAMILDDADLQGTERPKSVIFDALEAHNEHVRQIISGEHSCSLPRLTVFFLNDPETGDTYAVAEVAHREYAEALLEMDMGDYYPYWDESEGMERPFGIRSGSWEERGKVWSRVFAEVSADDPAGILRVDLGSAYPDLDLLTETEAVYRQLPDLGQRINRAMNGTGGVIEVESPADVSSIMAELPARFQHISASLRPITLNDLTGVEAP